MNSKTNTTNDDILNEIIGIEYEDDDALTLLDDEEMMPSREEHDEDLNSFYMDYQEPKPMPVKREVDLYTEKEIKKPEPVEVKVQPQEVKQVPVEVVAKPIEAKPTVPVPTVEKKNVEEVKPKETGYQSKLDQLSTNIDAYLNGSLDNRKDTVKVERMEPVVVKAATQTPVVPPTPQPVKPQIASVIPSYNSEPVKVEDANSGNVDDNLNRLFAKVSDNVRGASDVKRKMEDKFRELQRLYDEFEIKKKADYEEINAYKDEVYNKLKLKKEELDEQARKLKLEQDVLANQKKQFEMEKLKHKEEAKKKEQELLDAFKEREKNIEQVENGLIRRKEQLDLEKANIAKDRAQCEKEKKDLADNLVKFNQIVDDFTKGVDRFNDNN